MNDRYRRIARFYDALVEPPNVVLRSSTFIHGRLVRGRVDTLCKPALRLHVQLRLRQPTGLGAQLRRLLRRLSPRSARENDRGSGAFFHICGMNVSDGALRENRLRTCSNHRILARLRSGSPHP